MKYGCHVLLKTSISTRCQCMHESTGTFMHFIYLFMHAMSKALRYLGKRYLLCHFDITFNDLCTTA